MSHKVLVGKGLVPPAAGAGGDHDERPQLLQLPSPAAGAAQQFVLLPGGRGLLEVNRVRHEFGAWLVADRLHADGSCYMCTPLDPTYMLLALLDAQQEGQAEAADGSGAGGVGGGGGGGPAGMFQEASSLLCLDAWPGAAALEALAAAALPLICDVKGSGGDCYYRPSEQRVLAWMRAKLQQTLDGLREASPGSVAGLRPEDARAYTLGFMGEYLSPRRLSQLAGSCGLAPAGLAGATPAARPAAAVSGGAAGGGGGGAAGAAGGVDASQPRDKAQKVQPLDPKEAARRKQEEGRAEAKAARLAKEAKGTKSITAFFSARKK
ncbi:hypothetical protein Rsub_01515 [Raphidocelis subcapitata]|uniref:Uncharacterized protein n=1 Tax=Raphidocelis subcapitata TaxID=307507 RepID=A0A2V0NN94_9CHLO|nr:hypothetical protein Rsub_01515 [Raphidocelis subcapitata]|eukprot:GBF89016.1 hypothetical protein Rsub_01515 [Raphidocelis subcapitata]